MPLGSILREAFDLPIFLDNEANLAALAEAQYGAARGYRDVLYISAGVGLGGGIVRDGQIYRGVSGFAGEFGHMRVEPASEAGALGGAAVRLRQHGLLGDASQRARVVRRHLSPDRRGPAEHAGLGGSRVGADPGHRRR